ncbi:MAG: hypothetical protein KC425_20595 [Anaerolineales bacterium]|nr:hypothetical protein [Anaerolineales bacterium]
MLRAMDTDQTHTVVQAHYHAYLLRLWRETPQGPWRVLLIAADGEEKQLFASLDGLFAFLETVTAGQKVHPS